MKTNAPKIAAWSALTAILFVTLSPMSLRPHDLLPVNVDRALAFGILSTCFVLAYPRQWKWAIVAAAFAPGAMELLQLLSPTRHAHLEDVMFKTAGSLAGVPVGRLVSNAIATIMTQRRAAARQLALQKFSAKPLIEKLPVKSRMIESIYFSREDGQLRLRLSNGQDRLFDGVTEDDAKEMAAAPSPGDYYVSTFKPRYRRAA